ncbi:Bro-N domain-containing protein [Clostridium cuniculi]|uniref:BRO-N domain-containing protein n=1 Tax=Clostridium cuniculi TaxID=2548455 RepID=UPI0010563D1C|nr:BRO family protein [Clostridium cuniculi]
MNNNLMIFNNEEFGNIRMIEINGKPYAVGTDVAEMLEYERPSKAVLDHCKGVLKWDSLKVGGYPVKLIPQGDIIRLIVKSRKENADKLESWIFDDVIPKVLKTGRFDSKEEKLKLIEDETERNLRLTIHQYETIVKMNPTDVLSGMMLNNKQTELNTYLQSREIKKLKDEISEANARISNIFVIGDRKQFTNEVNSVARATGKDQSEIYTLTYKQLEDDYGIDLKTRVENKKRKIQDDRLNSGKKLLSPSTLKQKVNCLVIADEEQLWNELGKSLFKVKDILLRNKAS